MEAFFKFNPEGDETVLEFGVVEECDRFRNVAVVADGLVEIEDGVQSVLFAPGYEVRDELEHAVAVVIRGIFHDNLVESETDVVEPIGGDPDDVLFGDVAFKVFEIADGERQFPFVGKDVETFVVCEPSADAHAAGEAGEAFR